MLEFLFQAFFEWIYGLILEAWEYFSSGLIDLMSMDYAYLQTHTAGKRVFYKTNGNGESANTFVPLRHGRNGRRCA